MKYIFTFILFLSFCSAIFSQVKNIDFMQFEYNNSSCNGYQYINGSFIFIPDNAFCFADGTPCSDKVIVKYREFHAQVDILVAGLNMLATINGKDAMLESIGMFEIKAECKGKPVDLITGKSIQVRMKCRRKLPNVSAYKYDENQKRWNVSGQVFDFSFDNDKPFDENTRWGSSPVNSIDSVDKEMIDEKTGETYIVRSFGAGFIRYPFYDGIFKAMNVQSMGTYNYDGVINDKDAVPMIPEFVINTGESIGETVYVAYENRNTLVNYYQSDFTERFVLLNTKGIKIFTILKDGSYAVLKPGSLNSIDIKAMKGTKQKFVLEKKPKIPKTKEEIVASTGISNR